MEADECAEWVTIELICSILDRNVFAPLAARVLKELSEDSEGLGIDCDRHENLHADIFYSPQEDVYYTFCLTCLGIVYIPPGFIVLSTPTSMVAT